MSESNGASNGRGRRLRTTDVEGVSVEAANGNGHVDADEVFERATAVLTEAPPAQAADQPLMAPDGLRPAHHLSLSTRVGDIVSGRALSNVTGGQSAVPLVILVAIAFADHLDRSAFGVLIPEIRDYFGVNLATILTVISVAGVLPILLSVPIGYLADRRRRTRMIAGASMGAGLFSIGTAFAVGLPILGVMRFGSGMARTVDPATNSLIADYYPTDRRAGVFAVNEFGKEFGMIVGPTMAGVLAQMYSWQVPFLVFGVPAFVLGIVAMRLREPVRGAQERRELGVAEDVMEAPPGWTEGWRIAKSVRTQRRLWAAMPFIIGTVVVTGPLTAIYWSDIFGLSESVRGTFQSIERVFAVLGLVVGGAIGNRLVRRSPGRVLVYAGLLAMVPASGFVIMALSPWLPVSLGANYLGVFAGSMVAPWVMALLTLTIPPRARSFAMAFGALFVACGVVLAPMAGMFADRFGPRAGILFMVPVFVIGALIVSSAGATVAADMRAAIAAADAERVSREAKARGESALLVCRDVDVHYGQVQILFNVDLTVEEGEIVALLGTNGAGKSTLLNAIAGVTSPSNGAIFLGGKDITHLPSSDHVGHGIVMVPGGKGVFPSLTVAENLALAAWPFRGEGKRVDEATAQVLDFFPRLRERLHEPAGNLSGGEQQMLTLGQAFLARPRLLMIDELSLGLAPVVVEQLLSIVRAIHEAGTTIILVEQSVNLALTVAERAVFMEKGEVRFSGPTAELMQRGDILRSVFLAGSASAGGSYGRRRRLPGEQDEAKETVLRVDDVARSFGGIAALRGGSIELRQGEIVGIIGPNGAGKTTMFDVISGFVVPDSGTIELLGEDITDLTPDDRARRGLSRSFQDARLYPALTVEETLLVALDRHLSVKSGAMAALGLPNVRRSEARLRKRAERLIMLLNLGDFRDKFLRELSTGSRRLVDLGCVLATDPEVLLLDEPSSGIAQRETEELGPLLQRIKFETGCSLLLIEHDMQLISAVSDELVAMDLGRVVTRGKPTDVLNDPRVVEAYLGTSEAAIRRSGQLS